MPRIIALWTAACLALTGCIGGLVTTTPGPTTAVVIEGYQCEARTDTTLFQDTFGERSTTQECIACQNGEDYACGDLDRAACTIYVASLLREIAKDATPPAG